MKALALCLVCTLPLFSAWKLNLGKATFEGSYVETAMMDNVYSIIMQNDQAWFSFNFLSKTGKRPRVARVINFTLMGFEPHIECDRQAGSGVRLKGNKIIGSVACNDPKGTFRIYGIYQE